MPKEKVVFVDDCGIPLRGPGAPNRKPIDRVEQRLVILEQKVSKLIHIVEQIHDIQKAKWF